MVFAILTVDKNVGKIDHHEILNERSKNMIHQTLKGTRGIRQPKRHDLPLIQHILDVKSSLPLVSKRDCNLVISTLKINIWEYRSSCHHVKHIANARYGKMVFHSNLVDSLIVDIHVLYPILLWEQKYRNYTWAKALLDEPLAQRLNLCEKLLGLCRVQLIVWQALRIEWLIGPSLWHVISPSLVVMHWIALLERHFKLGEKFRHLKGWWSGGVLWEIKYDHQANKSYPSNLFWIVVHLWCRVQERSVMVSPS